MSSSFKETVIGGSHNEEKYPVRMGILADLVQRMLRWQIPSAELNGGNQAKIRIV